MLPCHLRRLLTHARGFGWAHLHLRRKWARCCDKHGPATTISPIPSAATSNFFALRVLGVPLTYPRPPLHSLFLFSSTTPGDPPFGVHPRFAIVSLLHNQFLQRSRDWLRGVGRSGGVQRGFNKILPILHLIGLTP